MADRVVMNQPPQPKEAAFRPPKWSGVGYPLRTDGMLALVVDDHAVNSSLRILLMTEPGERIMEPDFGVALRSLLFDQDSPGLQEEVVRRISTAIDRFDPRIVIASPGIMVESHEEDDAAPTGAVYIGVSFKWAFKANLSSKFSFATTLFRNDPAAQQAFISNTQ